MARIEQSTGGFLMGADVPLGEAWRAGAFGGYSHTDFDVKERNSAGDSYHLGAYSGAQWKNLGLRIGAGYNAGTVQAFTESSRHGRQYFLYAGPQTLGATRLPSNTGDRSRRGWLASHLW